MPDGFTTASAPDLAALAATLTQFVGPDHVSLDPATRAAMSEDVYQQGAPVALVVAPGDTDELSKAVAAITAAGRAILPRGGGMSYTSGYISDDPEAVSLDMRRLNRILEVNPTDMTVTVQAGATWADLLEALKPHGLRTPFWGPLSGISSTIGGGLSQLNAFFGAGIWGTTSQSVTSLAVVIADGSVIRTGSGASRGAGPFFRHYGPDLAGLFSGDCGALGIKAEITLRLIPTPAHETHASFAMDSLAQTADAMAEVGRANLACEVCGFDPNLAKIRLRRASLLSDAKTLAKVVTGQKTLLGGLKEGARMALAGRDFIEDTEWTLHLVVEGASRAEVDANMATLSAIMGKHQGRPIENTIPKAMRAAPFNPLNNVLGPDGQRWVPIHGIVSHSQGRPCWEAIQSVFDVMADRLAAHDILTGYLVTTIETNGFLIEPVFFYPDARFGLHETTVEASYLKKMPVLAADAGARALVEEARAAILDVFQAHGAAHFQIGRTYRYAETRSPETLMLLKAIKAVVDPDNRINPGALGL